MRVVVCYDVRQDSRRGRFFRHLRTLLEPVQKSVFEGDLTAVGTAEVERVARELLDLRTDTVRIFHLCQGCAGRISHIGTAERVAASGEDLVL